jgi:hypothetical protein
MGLSIDKAGRRVIAGSADSRLKVRRLEDRKGMISTKCVKPFGDMAVGGLDWSPAGEGILVTREDRMQVGLFDLENSRL